MASRAVEPHEICHIGQFVEAAISHLTVFSRCAPTSHFEPQQAWQIGNSHDDRAPVTMRNVV
jgi:hypothetical protein